MSEQKRTMREQAREHRKFADNRHEDIEAATPLFFDALNPAMDKVIAAYWPKEREFDPTHILEHALSKGHTCALPKVAQDSKVLEFIQYDEKTRLEKGAFGILEPQDGAVISPDIIIVPLLAYDRKGYRLGQGGGYYDATLAHYRSQKEIDAVGIGYASQAVLFTLPVEDHDQKLDWVLTPQGITRHKD